MRLSQAALLGLIQGITEFLPISSTAHLIAIPRWLGWQRPGLGFDACLHLGTLLASVWFFREDLKRLLPTLATPPWEEDTEAWEYLLGALPVGLAGLLYEDTIDSHFRAPVWLALGMAGGALLLAWAEHYSFQRSISARWTRLLMTASQTLALFPGISRSGITIATGLACGLSRAEAARQSFLGGFPVIAAAGMYKFSHLRKSFPSARETTALVTALTSATVSGYLSLHFLFRWLAKYSLAPLIWYRLGFALYLLYCQKHPPR